MNHESQSSCQSAKQLCALGLLSLTLAGGIANAGIASSLIWDDFDMDPNGLLGGAGDYSSTMFNDPFAQGGSFMLNTGFVSGADTGAVFFNSGIAAEQGASIIYDNLGDQGGSSMDFALIQAVAFEIDFLLSDQAFDLEIIMGGGGGVAVGSVTIPAGMEYTASFTIADLIISPNFDITDVNDVTFNFNLRDSATASLDFVTTEIRLVTVPSPGSMALFGLGGIMITRRRRG